jgi:DNA repair exonuclease SbcCD nuclease subunit
LPRSNPLRHIRFLQISDIHLESACSGLPWQEGQTELQRTFSAAIDLAKSQSVDLLLVPGDVYEHENETSGTARFLAAEFERANPTRVIVTPGNHDFCAAGTVWQRTAWPENVHVFREEETVEKTFPDLGVTIYGFAHNSPAPLRSILQDWRAPERNGKSILIFHGSLTGGAPPGKEVTCPFTPTDVEETGVDYAAVGHYHSFIEIRSQDGRLIGAYSGSPAGRGFDETGEKVVLLGEITDSGVSITKKTISRYRYRKSALSLDGVRDERQAEEKIRERVREASQRDVLRLVLEGKVFREFNPSMVSLDEDTMRVAHVELEWRVEPEYDVDSIARKSTTEGAFVRELLERIERAESEEEAETLRRAIYYGLDALSGKEPEQRG